MDERLIQQIRSGDPKQLDAAVAVLFAQNRASVAKIVRWGKGSDSDVQMILHDTIVDLIQLIQNGSYNPALAKINTLFFKIAKNKWLDEIDNRNRYHHRKTALHEKHVLSTTPLHNPSEEKLIKQEEKEAIVEALAQLGPPCRQLFQMKYLQGIPLKTIAETLNESENAIKKRHERCKKKLRKIMGNDPRIK